MQRSVEAALERLAAERGRYHYLSPAVYKELIHVYGKLYAEQLEVRTALCTRPTWDRLE